MSATGATGAALPTPDLTAAPAVAMSGTGGKIALSTTPLDACGNTATQCALTNVVDLVGYGNTGATTTAQQFEGSAPTPNLSNTTSAHRKSGGCVETDDNAADFEVGAPTPKNTATAAAVCGASDGGPPDSGPDTGAGGSPADSGPDTGPVDAGPPPVGLVIAELYGGAGNNAPFTNDYVVVFNRGTAPASLANVSVQYASATGSFSTSAFNVTALPSVTLAPGQYFLVGLGLANFDAGSPAPLPAPDATGTTNLSSTQGKVALVHGALLNGCGAAGSPCSGPGLLDLAGYGGASQFEGSAAAPPPGGFGDAVIRKQGGCTDTDDNANDFLAAPAGPKNTSSPINDCSALPDSGSGGTGGVAGGGGTAGAATGGTAGAATGGTAGAATGGTAGAATGGSGGTGGGATGGTGGSATGGSGGSVNPDGGGGIGNVGGFAGKPAAGGGDDGGCGCETPGNARNHSGLALLSLLGLAAFLRRRRS
jgi:MYXO-CTERM domain-containing protein